MLSLIALGLTAVVIVALIFDRLLTTNSMSEAAIAPAKSDDSPTQSTRRPAIRLALSDERVPMAVFFLVGFLLLIAGQIGLIGENATLTAIFAWLVGLLMLVFIEWRTGALPTIVHTAAAESPATIPAWRLVLLLAVAVASLFIWVESPDRSPTDSSLDIALLWAFSIFALTVASGTIPAFPSGQTVRQWLSNQRIEIGLASLVLLVAAVPRLFDLSSYAWSMSGDEGTFGVTARSTLEGALRNPFSSGPWGYPSLLFIVQGWFIDIFGGTVGSARMLSALFGIGSVLACYALVRHHFGRYPALLTVLFASVLSFHVYWSRDAQDASAPMFFIPLALLLLDRGIVEGRRGFVMAAGLTIAAAQFFHPANRLLLPMAVAYLVYTLGLRTWDAREFSVRAWKSTFVNGVWLAAAIIVGHLPLAAYYETHRIEFWSRTNEVSIFASGWLDREEDITGDSSLVIIWRQLWNAIMMPFSTVPHGHFRPGSPLVGWPLVALVAFGCALTSIWWFRKSYFGLALAFWATTVGLAMTEGPPMTNRYTPAAPLLAIFGALGLAALAGMVVAIHPAARKFVLLATAALALFIAAWHVQFYFHDPNQVELYSDPNSQIANHIAREAEALGDSATVYLSGAPRLYYYGFQNIDFIAPDATGIDVDPMWSPQHQPPEVSGPTLFAFVPERMAELDVVRSWFPNGIVTEHFLDTGEFLYTSLLVDESTQAGFSQRGER